MREAIFSIPKSRTRRRGEYNISFPWRRSASIPAPVRTRRQQPTIHRRAGRKSPAGWRGNSAGAASPRASLKPGRAASRCGESPAPPPSPPRPPRSAGARAPASASPPLPGSSPPSFLFPSSLLPLSSPRSSRPSALCSPHPDGLPGLDLPRGRLCPRQRSQHPADVFSLCSEKELARHLHRWPGLACPVGLRCGIPGPWALPLGIPQPGNCPMCPV